MMTQHKRQTNMPNRTPKDLSVHDDDDDDDGLVFYLHFGII